LRVKFLQEKPPPVSSSKPPDFPAEQVGLFRDVLRLLNGWEIPYAVSGAFALHEHTGIWRDTKDLDLFLAPEDATRALEKLREQGFACEICDPVWLAKTRRNGFFVDLITGMSNAAIRVDDSWIERSLTAELFGEPTRMLNAEELLASKLFVLFRERYDGADMVHILYARRGRIDWQRLLQLIGEHRDLLLATLVLFHYVYPAENRAIPGGVWDLLLGDLRESLKAEDTRPMFRGSLLDENMFAIDVKEWGLPDLTQEYRARKRGRIEERAA